MGLPPSYILGIFIVCHLLIQNGSFTFLADIFESKLHFEDALCNLIYLVMKIQVIIHLLHYIENSCLTINILCRCSAYLWICGKQVFSLSTTIKYVSPCYTRPYSKYSCELQANSRLTLDSLFLLLQGSSTLSKSELATQ